MAMTAAIFSSNTNILSPPPQRHPPLRSSSALQFPVKYSTQQFRYSSNYSSPAAPILSCVSAAAAEAATTTADDLDSASISTTSSWVEFAEKVSGEWDGFGADFTAEGQAVELPESVVPEAYREWEVKVFDWQTQCPTLAETLGSSPSLTYRSIKLLPTVGCEADAATVYTSEERNISDASAFAYASTGCYVAERRIDSAAKSVELEYCLIDPTNKESRVRVIQVLNLQESEPKLARIKVFVEQWYGPFRNGDQLGGCAIRDSAFAATDRLEASRVCGVWQGIGAVARFDASHNMIQQLGDERASKSIRDERGLVLLPKQLWSSVKRGGAAAADEICCEVGWLLDEGRAITSKCIFSSEAELKEIAIANETATQI
ncbi:uncharacterized protein LOC131020854 isoform X2 [Salvia miltiorrhiza]|uniref:uncharacterized protein LOC131020854 isoform X2 n=1 Tax=Salvia miltiorrhiza TaxID=226208 RepID=UPI0025AD0B60|nr:uncharacterized protein LOC131020854 isoform X2 [Salvia miltiorrhiza]